MTVESNHATTIATLSDWLKRLAPVFQPMRSKTKTNRTLYARFFSRFEQVRNSDLFITLFAPVVIGWSNYLGTGFSLYSKETKASLYMSTNKVIICLTSFKFT